jgi:Tol biopolymer transport system component
MTTTTSKRLACGAAIVSTLALAGPARATAGGRDGRIAFIQAGDVYTMRADGSGSRRLTALAPDSGGHASWSSDGRTLAFDVSLPDGSAQLWTMQADGSRQRVLLDEPGIADLDPSFAPDDRHITFSRCSATCVIYRIRSDGTRPTGLTAFDPGLADFQSVYSPDGRTIAFGRFATNGSTGGIALMDADGANVRPLTPPELGADDPAWSPNGARLVFGTHCCDPQNSLLWTIRADGRRPRQLTDGTDVHDFQPAWAPRGDAIAFERHTPSAETSGIYVVRPDGTGVRMIERGGTEPRWGSAP